jgi:hypothetical protein
MSVKQKIMRENRRSKSTRYLPFLQRSLPMKLIYMIKMIGAMLNSHKLQPQGSRAKHSEQSLHGKNAEETDFSEFSHRVPLSCDQNWIMACQYNSESNNTKLIQRLYGCPCNLWV